MNWHKLTIEHIEKPTAESTTLTFKVPADLGTVYRWQPGQHIKLRLKVEGQMLERSYSISSDDRQMLRVTVKRIEKGAGTVSSYINAKLKTGDVLEVSAPHGHFVLTPDVKNRRCYYFFAAGSGITPIYAMINAVLGEEPESSVYLLYGNKNLKSTIFAELLASLAEKYPQRFAVQHCYSSPGWFDTNPWRKGRIDASAVHDFIREYPPYAQDTQYYLCGPGQFLTQVKQSLNAIDVPDVRIHLESFGNAKLTDQPAHSVTATLEVKLRGEQFSINVEPGESVLDALLAKGITAPHSCEAGVCGTCRCTLKSGEVYMANNLVLDEQEVKDGEVLACQAQPLTENIQIQFAEK